MIAYTPSDRKPRKLDLIAIVLWVLSTERWPFVIAVRAAIAREERQPA
jgi:hypothetical protein